MILYGLWEYYLCYCEAGFLERYTGVVHMLMNKPAYGRGGDQFNKLS